MRTIEIDGLKRGEKRVRQVRFAAGAAEPTIAIQAGDGRGARTVRWLRLTDGKELRRRDLPVRGAPDAALSPDLAVLAFVERPGDVDLLVVERPGQPEVGRRYASFWGQHDVPDDRRIRYEALAISLDGKVLRACEADNGFVGWRIGKLFAGAVPADPGATPLLASLRTGDHADPPVTCLTFGPKEFAAVGCANGLTFLFSKGGEPWAMLDPDEEDPVRCVAFNHNSKVLCVAAGHQVAVWTNEHEDDQEVCCRLEEHEGEVNGVTFSADGKAIATVSTDGALCLWNMKKKKATLRSALNLGIGALTAVAFSPDGFVCVVGSADGRLAVVDLDD